MNPAGERILKALAAVGPSSELTLPQAAFNFLINPDGAPETQRLLADALDKWADSVLAPLEESCHVCCPGTSCPCASFPDGEDEFCKCDHTQDYDGNGDRWADDGGRQSP